MCVIYFKPAGKDFVSEDLIVRMWEANPHGAGIAFQDGGRVVVCKGFMELDLLLNVLKDLKKELKYKNTVVHFRLASKGSVDMTNTHPFVISKDQPAELVFRTERPVLFHNGTVTGFGSDTKSDTRELAEWLGGFGKLSIRQMVDILKKLSWSDRFLVMSPRRVYLVGRWEKKDGQFFSNYYFAVERKIVYPYWSYQDRAVWYRGMNWKDD